MEERGAVQRGRAVRETGGERELERVKREREEREGQ